MIGLSQPFTIAGVEPGSLAERLGLQAGERILAVNGVPIRDEVEYSAQISEQFLSLRIRGVDGAERDVEGVREYGVAFGAEFEARLPKRCHNNCVFCFVYQHPRGVRRELLVKDDDYVFSFVHGNFITLTNLAESDFQRIMEERLSPLYISVHATDPGVRVRMMKNAKAGLILEQIDRLAAAGVEMHTQLVVCPGWNDGEVLSRSIRELSARHPSVASVSVVPVGLTKHRDRLPSLRLMTPEEGRSVLREVEACQATFLSGVGRRIVFAADELYVLAGEAVPEAEAYEGFPQLENGIGMLRDTIDRWMAAADVIRPRGPKRERVAVVTAASAAPTLRALFEARPPQDLSASLCVVRNEYFGESVTVSGLLVGADIERALRSQGPFDRVLLPPNCLKEGERFLDDRTRSELSRSLGVDVDVGFDAGAGA